MNNYYITIFDKENNVIISYLGKIALDKEIIQNDNFILDYRREEPIFSNEEGKVKFYPEHQNKIIPNE